MSAPMSSPPAHAIGFTKELKKRVSEDDYVTGEPFDFRGVPHAGLRYYDVEEGRGAEIKPGSTAEVHFDCKFRGITVVSSRQARTLGGNRTVAEPLELRFGKLPSEFEKPLKRKVVVGIGAEVRIDPELDELYVVNTVYSGPADRALLKPNDSIVSINGVKNLASLPITEIGALLQGDAGTSLDLVVRRGRGAELEALTLTREATAVVPKRSAFTSNDGGGGGGGLFSGENNARPPPVVYVPQALAGMKVGGRRSIIVPADVGYEDVGEGEIPPGAKFIIDIELLDTKSGA